MAKFTLMLKTQVRKAQASAAGATLYFGGDALDASSNRLVAKFAAVSETIAGVTDDQHLNTGTFSLTLFAVTAHHQHGGGGGGGGGHPAHGQAPQNMVLEGAPKFEGQQPPTANQPKDIEQAIGSVTAASPMWAQFIDQQFVLINDKLEIG